MSKKNFSDLDRWKVLVKSDVNQAASDFGDQTREDAAKMADELGVGYMVNVVTLLTTDDAVELLRSLPADFREKVLAVLDPEQSTPLKELLSYKSGTAGALMAKEYLAIPVTATIKQATEYLQSLPQNKKGKVSYIYVVDQNRLLEGVIQIRDLIFYPPSTPVNDILIKPVVQVETGMSQMDVTKLLQRHNYLGLPVVNEAQQLVGVISADNALEVLEEEASDDIAKIVGTSAEELKTSSVRRIIWLRLPWLFFSILSGLLCAFISGVFENSIQTIATLFLFVPVVLGLSESTGVQSATIIVRNLALGHVSFKQLTALFFREISAGIFIGIICGLLVGVSAYFWKSEPEIGLSIASSMSLAITCAALIGLILPIIFKKMKFDPAIASGPLVLALCDIQTLLIYFNLSLFILK